MALLFFDTNRPPTTDNVLALGLVALFAFIPSTALSQSDSERAKTVDELSREEKKTFLEFFRAGKEAYTQGEFERAIPFFEKAYNILPKPALQYRIGLSHERAGNLEKALEHYRTFLQQKPDSAKRGQVKSAIEKLENEVEARSQAYVDIESNPPGAEVYVRAAGNVKRELHPRGRTPLTLELVSGSFELILEKEGYRTVRRPIEVEPGENYNYNYELPRTGSSASAGSKTVPLVATIVGGAASLVGGTLYAVGLHCGRNRENCSRSLFNTAAIGSYVGGGLGVAGLGTAAVIGLTGDSGSRALGPADRQRNLGIEVMLGPSFVGLRLPF